MGQHKHNQQALYYKSNPKRTAHLSSGETYECVDFEIRLTSLQEMFPQEMYQGLKSELKPQMNGGECHKNAWKFAQTFQDIGAEYCEGILLPDGMPPIHHCFNRFRGKFVDVTQEIALDKNLSENKWNAVRVLRIFPAPTIQRIFETEMRSFITYDGYSSEDGSTVYYDDEGNRQTK